MTSYYNEIDPYCAAWLQNLMDAGHIAPGVIATRSLRPDSAFDQVMRDTSGTAPKPCLAKRSSLKNAKPHFSRAQAYARHQAPDFHRIPRIASGRSGWFDKNGPSSPPAELSPLFGRDTPAPLKDDARGMFELTSRCLRVYRYPSKAICCAVPRLSQKPSRIRDRRARQSLVETDSSCATAPCSDRNKTFDEGANPKDQVRIQYISVQSACADYTTSYGSSNE